MHVVDQAVKVIQERLSAKSPKIGFVLGSGQAALVELIEESVQIPYDMIPGFPEITVKGHQPFMISGYINGVPVICLQGRSHHYEALDYTPVKNYVRAMQGLGIELLFLTNASGSLRVDIEPGELMMITDHINLMPGNPLAGPNEDSFGPRFFPMEHAYDPEIFKLIRSCAEKTAVRLKEGVYMSVLGPNFETAAEIKAFRMLGADAVGMSTVPEVLVARHLGLKVAAVATITNYGTGLGHSQHGHDTVLAVANSTIDDLKRLIFEFVGKYHHVN